MKDSLFRSPKFYLALLLLLLVSAFVYLTRDDPPPQTVLDQFSELKQSSVVERQAELESRERERLMRGGKYYNQLEVLADLPGIYQPELIDASEVELPTSSRVVGIEVGGIPYAFVVESMIKPERHIANLVLNDVPISVTYCDLSDCARVLTKDAADLTRDDEPSPLPLGVGGVDVEHRLVVTLDGERYGQLSEQIPAVDHDFERTTWGEWLEKHPQTKVYVAPPVETD